MKSAKPCDENGLLTFWKDLLNLLTLFLIGKISVIKMAISVKCDQKPWEHTERREKMLDDASWIHEASANFHSCKLFILFDQED